MYDSNIEVKCFDLIELHTITKFAAEYIDLSRHHLEEHGDLHETGLIICALDVLSVGIDIDAVYDTLDERQKNLFLWVGHIMSRKNPMQIFADL